METNENTLRTIDTCNINLTGEYLQASFNYQPKLTQVLDQLNENFDQDIINKIVLWKVNRYAEIPDFILEKINRIEKGSDKLDVDLTKDILTELLNVKIKVSVYL